MNLLHDSFEQVYDLNKIEKADPNTKMQSIPFNTNWLSKKVV